VTLAAAIALLALAGGAPAPEATAAACATSSSVVVVRLSRYPHILDHAIYEPGDRRRRGLGDLDGDPVRKRHPRILHWHPERSERNRRAWEHAQGESFPPRALEDRDEYPPAATSEGGAWTDLRYVDDGDNQGAGSVMGHTMRRYCRHQRFRFGGRVR
jgi:Deoxyribonuclease NucA/NucB